MKKAAGLIFFVLCTLHVSGCVYTNVRLPRAYRSATPSDVKAQHSDKTVTGETCAYSLLYLVAWGDGGYAGATRKALAETPEAILYDVKTDRKFETALMGLYTRFCTVVTGRVASQ